MPCIFLYDSSSHCWWDFTRHCADFSGGVNVTNPLLGQYRVHRFGRYGDAGSRISRVYFLFDRWAPGLVPGFVLEYLIRFETRFQCVPNFLSIQSAFFYPKKVGTKKAGDDTRPFFVRHSGSEPLHSRTDSACSLRRH